MTGERAALILGGIAVAILLYVFIVAMATIWTERERRPRS